MTEINPIPFDTLKRFLRDGETPQDLDFSDIAPNQMAALLHRRLAWEAKGDAHEARQIDDD